MKFAQQFSRPGKSLKNREKARKKIVKSFFESFNKCFASEIFFLLVKSYSILPVHVRLQRIVDKVLFLLFLRSLLLTYLITLSLEKEIIVLEKILNFGSKNLYKPWKERLSYKCHYLTLTPFTYPV